ncbi:unnamed protein product [Notodromas monacha]|uniref:Uncharacterized protein n=1 Tax=Notodromas monacha TaxID=399045 RepID=A0A7R9G7V0_9CRUS|nr:unnamed protein product [Notodromas monacha]CAG0912456.1 unnamed protein product [Notodromas monacha]
MLKSLPPDFFLIIVVDAIDQLENLALNDLMSVAKENMAAHQHHYLPNANELEQIRKCLSSVQSIYNGLTRLDLCSRISEADDELVFQRFIVQRGMHALAVLAMSLLLVRMKREALYIVVVPHSPS